MRTTDRIRVLADPDAVARAAADEIVSRAEEAIAMRRRFTLALSGGSTPRALYQLLAAGGHPPYRERIDWTRTTLFQGDERAVPAEHADSNYRMQREALIDRVPLAAGQAFRFHTELGDVERVAAEYDRRLRSALAPGPGAWPIFDVVLLGLGTDGHTASLFPNSPALAETSRVAVANPVAALGSSRLTLTAAAINRARAVLFLVAGADKADALARVLEGPSDPQNLPAQLIAPSPGELLWLVDDAAAARLQRR